MKRRLFNVLAGVSLVLCVMAAILWVLSYWYPVQGDIDRLISQPPNRMAFPDHMVFFSFDSTRGTLGLSYSSLFGHTIQFDGWQHHWDCPPKGPLYSVANPTPLDRLGLHLIHQSWTSGVINDYVVEFPYWLLLLIFSAAATLSVRRILSFRHLDYPVCSHCGYDLRVTPDRCPECGTVRKAAD